MYLCRSVADPDPHGSASNWKVGSGSGSESHKSDQLDPDPDPHENSDKLDPAPYQFADDKPKCMEYEPIWAPFQGSEP